MSHKPTVILDFDGVVHSYVSGWKGADVVPDPPVEGAFEAIESYLEAGLDVAIFSTRTGQPEGVKAMKVWFQEHGASSRIMAELRFPLHKPPAIVSIDDRAVLFQGTFPTSEEVLSFKTWQRK